MSEYDLIAGECILFVLGGLELGGAERQALHLARYLNKAGFNVQVWGFGPPGAVADLCTEAGISWRTIPFTWQGNRLQKLAALLHLTRELRRIKPDVILPYTMWPNVACGVVWRMTGARRCLWNQRDEGLHRMGNCIERLAVRNASGWISNSTAGIDFLVNTYGIRREAIMFVHNGIELNKCQKSRAEWRAELGLSEEDFVACMVANFHIYKDHDTLLRSWVLVSQQLDVYGLRAMLLLAGYDSGTLSQLKSLAFDLNLCEHVRFLGQVHDISGLLKTADLGTFSSQHEGCPNAILEYMAAGLPVVATDIPGIRDAVGYDGGNLLAPIQNAEVFADQVIRFALNARLRGEVGAANQRRIHESFSVEQMCQTMRKLIIS